MNRQMEWYRMYTEARTDAKLRALSDAEHRVWFHLLCFAAEQEGVNRGSIISYDDELLAVEVSNADAALLRVTLNRLRVLRIITEDEDPETGEKAITFCSFKRRQYDKPSDEPERVKSRVAAFRARNKQTRNANVTPSNALEVEEDADADSEPDSPSGKSGNNPVDDAEAAAAKITPLRKGKQPSADEWQHTAQTIASRLKLGPAKVNDLLALFEQYPHPPNYFTVETGKCLEWCDDNKKRPNLRTFSNWLLRAEEHAQQAKQEVASRASQNGRARTAHTERQQTYTKTGEDTAPEGWN